MLIWQFHVSFISLTKRVNNGFKAAIHNISYKWTENINISIEYLFLDVVGPMTHQCGADKLNTTR